MTPRTRLLLLLCLPLALPGCLGKESEESGGFYSAPVNYNHDRTYSFTLYDLTVENAPAIAGSVVYPLESGTSASCCIKLPATWRPGLKVRLAWRESDHTIEILEDSLLPHRDLIGEHEEELEIPRYETPGNLYVTFLPESRVELVVSRTEPGSETWPGAIKQSPWDRCVEKHGRMPCKLTGTYIQFDVTSYRGFCTSTKRKGLETSITKDGRQIRPCEIVMAECLRDYEDEGFCNRALWGKERKGCIGENGEWVWCKDQQHLADEEKGK